MASIEITRTELVWPGKYDEHGNRVVPERVNLPFQVIETINESRASREAGKRPAQTTLFDVWGGGDRGETFADGWRNKLVWGDNLLDASLETGPKCALSVRLTDFAMSDADAIPEDVRDKITKWSDYVDYWAIDWDFRNDTFMNGWVAYRTRRDRKLPLEVTDTPMPTLGPTRSR